MIPVPETHANAPDFSADLAVVLPFHNEGENVDALMNRLLPVLGSLGLNWHILAVDDGSRDDTFARLQEWRAREPRLRLIRLARNFGKDTALTCGLHHADAHGVVLMDSDLQHPPEVIPQMVAQWKAGARMVHAVRRNRDTDPWLRRVMTWGYYRLFHRLAEIDLPEGSGDFRLLDHVVVDALNHMPERGRFMKGLMSWTGFPQASVPFDVEQRHAGQSSWNMNQLIRFGFDGLAAFSVAPLRWSALVGFAVSLAALLYLVVVIVETLVRGIDVPGYASLMVAVLFLGGVQLTALGILGEYVGRIFIEVKRRPLYLVSERHGTPQAPSYISDRRNG